MFACNSGTGGEISEKTKIERSLLIVSVRSMRIRRVIDVLKFSRVDKGR